MCANNTDFGGAVPRLVNRITLSLAAATVFLAANAGAQIVGRRPAARRIPNWAGVSVGITQGFGVSDGSTSSAWNFGSGLEYAARLEHPVSSGAFAVGVQGSWARLPVDYSSGSFAGEAKADVTQLLAVLRYGSGYGFHPVYELSGGVIGFSNFRSTGMPQIDISNSTDWDPKIALGYGFGFGLSSTAAVEIVQELGTILHQRTGLSASQSNYPRIYVTRLGGKIAF
jgi:hypothetical protein